MIINRAFYREVIQTSIIVLVIFVALFLVTSLVSLLAKAVSGKLPVEAIFVLLGLQTLKNLSLMLPLALFLGILLTLSRWYRDSEMTVLNACGIGLMYFLRPALVLALWGALAVGLIAFYFGPLASSHSSTVRAEQAGNTEIGIAPGVFQRSRRDGGIFYVERVAPDGTLNDVFASSAHLGKAGVVIARSGFQHMDASTGDEYLVLQRGTRYEGIPGKADYKILEFESYAIRLEPRAVPVPRTTTLDEMGTRQLLRSEADESRAEFQWRLAKPVSLFILVALALPFAYTDARRGQFANLFTAILVYFFYINLLGVGNALLRQGRLPPEPGLWAVHALFALLAVYLLRRRARNQPLLPPIPLPGLRR